MNKQYVKEMNLSQKSKLVESNKKLQALLVDAMQETESYYVNEQLEYFKGGLSDWSIGAYEPSYMTIKDGEQFLHGVNMMQSEIPLFSDEDFIALKTSYLLKKIATLEVIESVKRYEQLENWLNAKFEYIADRIVTEFKDRLEIEDLTLDDFVSEMDAASYEDYYILDADYTTLYLDVIEKIG